jgi:hypothetical protein
MTCPAHDAIIARGFRETRSIGGAAATYGKRETCYQRGEYEIRYTDYGPNKHQPHAPDSNRYVMKLFLNGKKISGGTAWYAILRKVEAKP